MAQSPASSPSDVEAGHLRQLDENMEREETEEEKGKAKGKEKVHCGSEPNSASGPRLPLLHSHLVLLLFFVINIIGGDLGDHSMPPMALKGSEDLEDVLEPEIDQVSLRRRRCSYSPSLAAKLCLHLVAFL